MAEAEILQQRLATVQNCDGGWGYHAKGKSWTEPTALALLAISAADGGFPTSFQRGCRWLIKQQRADGGWSPNAAVPKSTWVTSLSYLALRKTDWPGAPRARAVEWLLGQSPATSGAIYRFIAKLRRTAPLAPAGGCPWFPGTAAWVAPTVFSVLALSCAARTSSDPPFWHFIEKSQAFLLSRRCEDGGWNHGGSSYRSESAVSYPEMTGMALLAFRGNGRYDLARSIQRAKLHLDAPGSVEGLSWLQLALRLHGVSGHDFSTHLPCRTNRDICLRLLALCAQNGPHPLTA